MIASVFQHPTHGQPRSLAEAESIIGGPFLHFFGFLWPLIESIFFLDPAPRRPLGLVFKMVRADDADWGRGRGVRAGGATL